MLIKELNWGHIITHMLVSCKAEVLSDMHVHDFGAVALMIT